MKFLFSLLLIGFAALPASGLTLTGFELTDQHLVARSYRFPKPRVTVMTVADQKGSQQLAPWIQQIHDRYHRKIDIDGVADVSNIPKPLQNFFRGIFRNQLAYSVMLDWDGAVVRQFAPEKGVANIFVIDRRGRIVGQATGPMNANALEILLREIDRTLRES